MKKVKEEKIQDGKDAALRPVTREHEAREEDRLPDVAPRPADVHPVHLPKP